MKTGRGWGIECGNGDICVFIELMKERLEDFKNETSRAVRVRILKESDYRKEQKIKNDLIEACSLALGAFENNNAIDWNILERALEAAGVKRDYRKLVKNQKEQAK